MLDIVSISVELRRNPESAQGLCDLELELLCKLAMVRHGKTILTLDRELSWVA